MASIQRLWHALRRLRDDRTALRKQVEQTPTLPGQPPTNAKPAAKS